MAAAATSAPSSSSAIRLSSFSYPSTSAAGRPLSFRHSLLRSPDESPSRPNQLSVYLMPFVGAEVLLFAWMHIQLITIELRVPEYGWTTQKVFHLMNFIVNGVRAIVFGFHISVFYLHPKVLIWILLDLPGLLFFSTYTLLVLFWAEIYHQARSLPTDKLRIVYISVNAAMYVIQVFPKIKDYVQGGIMLFISSYFEFVRVRNFLKSQNASFCLLDDNNPQGHSTSNIISLGCSSIGSNNNKSSTISAGTCLLVTTAAASP